MSDLSKIQSLVLKRRHCRDHYKDAKDHVEKLFSDASKGKEGAGVPTRRKAAVAGRNFVKKVTQNTSSDDDKSTEETS